MVLEHEFVVPASKEKAWKLLLDLERVAPCVPGAEIGEQTGPDAYDVTMHVRVGPMSVRYKGAVRVIEVDESAGTAVMEVRAKEMQGQGSATAQATMTLSGNGQHTHAKVATELRMTGRVASMGRGVMQDAANQIVETFARNLAAVIEGDGTEAGGTGSPHSAPVARDSESTTNTASGADALNVGPVLRRIIVDRIRQRRALVTGVIITNVLAFVIGFVVGRIT